MTNEQLYTVWSPWSRHSIFFAFILCGRLTFHFSSSIAQLSFSKIHIAAFLQIIIHFRNISVVIAATVFLLDIHIFMEVSALIFCAQALKKKKEKKKFKKNKENL